MTHQLQDVEDAGAEHDEVDDDERQQRGRDCGRIESRHRVGGTQQAIHGVGLAPYFGRHPAGDHRHKARRPHRQGEAMQQRPVVEPPPDTGEQAECGQRQHQHSHADHDAEGPEDDGHRRPFLAVDGVETVEWRIERVLEN